MTTESNFFPLFSVAMKWVLHPNVAETTMENVGIMAIGGGVHTDGNGKENRLI